MRKTKAAVPCLVTHADEVIAESLNRVGGGTGLHVLGVVGDEDGLGGLDDDDSLFALQKQVKSASPRIFALFCASRRGEEKWWGMAS